VSGKPGGMIGSSNNPVSGLTLRPHRAALAHGFHRRVGQFRCGGGAGSGGRVVCVSSAVAGEMLQDLKVATFSAAPRGTCRSATSWNHREQRGALLPAVHFARRNIKAGGTGFGDLKLPAPQARLMAMLAQGIVGHKHAMAVGGGGHFHGLCADSWCRCAAQCFSAGACTSI